MNLLSGTRLQTALVVVLFLTSLAALVLNGVWPLLLPAREIQTRATLREASRRMADQAAPIAEALNGGDGILFDDLSRQLHQVAERSLADFPGVEGGFYLNDGDRFAGYAFPTEESHPDPPLKPDKKKGPPAKPEAKPEPPPKPKGKPAQKPHARADPPPKEAPVIRGQAQQSVGLPPGEFLASVQDVGPSRVAFVTEPVGGRRPAALVTWVMFRVKRPEEADARLPGYVASSALALSGIAVALLLTWRLGRTLRRQRREQEQLRDELRRAEHLAGLGRLLAGVAHEVRNPLAAIRSTVQLWQRLPDEARTPASLEGVLGAVDRLNAIVTRLLYFSRADEPGNEPVDLNVLLGEVLDLLHAQAEGQGVVFERDFAADVLPVAGPAAALCQVALNLLTNALQAIPHGGRLRCATRYDGRTRTAEVRVSDTGPGVPAEDRRHLFEPFFTTRPDGTGLGLALCREIVARRGGRIALEEEPGWGATFVVVLPVLS